MDIYTGAIQSYQKNQNLSGWVQQNEALTGEQAAKNKIDSTQEDSVTLSPRRKIFDWLAQEFPHSTSDAADISRLSQTLYEYQILTIDDVKAINTLLANRTDGDFLAGLEQQLAESSSFSDKQQLRHLNQVFSTLVAAEITSAA